MFSPLLISIIALGMSQSPNTAINSSAMLATLRQPDVLNTGKVNAASDPQTTDLTENGQVVGKRTVSFIFNASWEIKDSGERWYEDEIVMACINRCQGKKHQAHEECDSSCDVKCQYDHCLYMEGEFEPSLLQTLQAKKDISNAARDTGINANINWLSFVMPGVREARRLAWDFDIDTDLDHWDPNPCHYSLKEWTWKRYDFNIKGEFSRHIVETRNGVKSEKTEPGGSFSNTLGYLWVPDIEGLPVADGPYCLCTRDSYVPIPQPLLAYSLGFFGHTGEHCEYGPENTELSFRGYDLNYLQATLRSPEKDLVASIPAGYEFVPENRATQRMISMDPVSVSVRPMFASIIGSFVDDDATRFRVLCTEMDKKAPTEKDKFKAVPCTDEGRLALAKRAHKSRFRGPADQARLWIYTDQATLDDVLKKMSPGVSKGQYVNAAYDVSRLAMVNMTDRKYRKCLQPDLLLGQTASSKATRWLVNSLVKVDANKLANSMRSVSSQYRQILGPDADDFDIKHAVDIAYSLGTSSNEKVRISGLEFLLKAVPERHRQTIADEGGLIFLEESISSKSEKEALKAIEVIEAYGGEDQLAVLRAIVLSDAKGTVKKKAEEVLQKLS